MKNKVITLMGVLISVAFLIQLCGCTTKTAKTDSDTVISWYMPKAVDNVQDQEAVEEEANKILQKQIGVKLKFHLIENGSYDEKMNVMAASRENYDIAFTNNGVNKFYTNVQRGSFLELNDLLDKYGKDILAKEDPLAMKVVTVNGKIMAIPGQNPHSTPEVLVFKKEFIDKYHFDYKSVKSLSDVEPYLETIKKNEQGITPLLSNGIPDKPSPDYAPLTAGLEFSEKEQKVVKVLDTPASIQFSKLINDYYKKGYIAKDAATKSDFMSEAKSGKYAVLKGSGAYTEDGSKSTSFYGYPCVETLLGYSIITTDKMLMTGSAISKTSKNPEKAMQLLNLVWKNKYLSNTLAYGVEGINYTVASGKGTDNISVIPKSGKEQTWALWHNWIGPLWDQWDSPWNSTASLKEMQHNNEIAPVSSICGFMVDSEPVKSEIAQLSSVNKEVSSGFSTGSMPDFDQYLATARQKFSDAGIDKVLKEIQRQIDEWKKANNK